LAEVSIYTSAFWSSDCCGAPFWRVMFLDAPTRFVCQRCVRECAPDSDYAWPERERAEVRRVRGLLSE
jgi:hypothetical protein